MNVNGITSSQAAAAYSYTAKEDTKAAKTETTQTESSTTAETGVVYESSVGTETSSVKKTYTANTELVNKLKADAEARTAQLRSIVEKLITGQATAYGNANDIWSILSSGDFTVDAATKAQAQADIAEDGYWGVSQTSQRILDFATALTGGDPDKIEEMRSAFEKGYKQAEKTWGGELPSISKDTYDAVMKGFDDLAAAAAESDE